VSLSEHIVRCIHYNTLKIVRSYNATLSSSSSICALATILINDTRSIAESMRTSRFEDLGKINQVVYQTM
jgi:hypothetical protein